MSLLIDGYNLIFGTSVESRGRGGALERARTGLIEFLASQVDRAKFKTITVVFDSANSPPGLASYFEEQGIKVHFARDHRDADELLEELIAASHAPGRLTVVSSDHRVQRAAKRRGATAVDSQVWFAEQRTTSQRKAKTKEVKPAGPLSAGETAAWMQFFGAFEIGEAAPVKTSVKKLAASKNLTPNSPPSSGQQLDAQVRNRKGQNSVDAGMEKELNVNLANPFPPGYAGDLFE
jgi:predicted RNA-binding protein with PIN domain